MVFRFFTMLTGRNLPRLQLRHSEAPSIINEKTIADFTRVVEQTRILRHGDAQSPDPVDDLARFLMLPEQEQLDQFDRAARLFGQADTFPKKID